MGALVFLNLYDLSRVNGHYWLSLQGVLAYFFLRLCLCVCVCARACRTHVYVGYVLMFFLKQGFFLCVALAVQELTL